MLKHCAAGNASVDRTGHFCLSFGVDWFFALSEWKMACIFLVPHSEKAYDDNKPVQVVRYDGAISGRVLPSKECIEDAPSAATIELWVAKLFMLNIDHREVR